MGKYRDPTPGPSLPPSESLKIYTGSTVTDRTRRGDDVDEYDIQNPAGLPPWEELKGFPVPAELQKGKIITQGKISWILE